MLPRPLRLSRQGFEENKSLSRTSTAHFGISYGPATDKGGSAVIVSKKIAKSAVSRHLLKRRIKVIIKPFSSKNRVLIISLRPGSQNLSFSEANDELSTKLKAILV